MVDSVNTLKKRISTKQNYIKKLKEELKHREQTKNKIRKEIDKLRNKEPYTQKIRNEVIKKLPFLKLANDAWFDTLNEIYRNETELNDLKKKLAIATLKEKSQKK